MNLIQQRLSSQVNNAPQQSSQQIFLQNVNDLKQMLGNASNPQQMVLSLASKNPEVQRILQLYQAGKSPQELISLVAKERGLDPAFVMSQFK